jgi:hypothetical protein
MASASPTFLRILATDGKAYETSPDYHVVQRAIPPQSLLSDGVLRGKIDPPNVCGRRASNEFIRLSFAVCPAGGSRF